MVWMIIMLIIPTFKLKALKSSMLVYFSPWLQMTHLQKVISTMSEHVWHQSPLWLTNVISPYHFGLGSAGLLAWYPSCVTAICGQASKSHADQFIGEHLRANIREYNGPNWSFHPKQTAFPTNHRGCKYWKCLTILIFRSEQAVSRKMD